MSPRKRSIRLEAKTRISYPSAEEVDKADLIMLAFWYHHLPLPSPSTYAKNIRNSKTYDKTVSHEVLLVERIRKRLEKLGGTSLEISKVIGWYSF